MIETKTKLTLDLAIFIAFLIAMEPRASGVAAHEWLATAILAAIIFLILTSLPSLIPLYLTPKIHKLGTDTPTPEIIPFDIMTHQDIALNQ